VILKVSECRRIVHLEADGFESCFYTVTACGREAAFPSAAPDELNPLPRAFSSSVHFGLARFSVRVHADPVSITATLTGHAYETIPNKPIITGKTDGEDEATLGHLATGASAIPAWRMKPTAATIH